MGKRVFLKRVHSKPDLCRDKEGNICYCSFKIFKQIHFERNYDQGYCNECYFYLNDEPYCSFPKNKNPYCDEKIYKLIDGGK